MIEEKPLPEFIYKYTSMKNITRIIESGTLWFSSPKEFNDPYDCNVKLLDFTPSQSEIKDFINEKVTGNRKTRREEIKKNLKNPYRIVNQTSEQTQQLFYNAGVSCFSDQFDNMLMWGHYTDNHKGVCVKFSSEVKEICLMATWVNYQDDFSKVNFFRGKGDAIYHLVFTKSKHWEYEREIRLYQLYNGAIEFKKEWLAEVIFGCKATKEDVNKIKDLLVKNNFKNISLRKAMLGDSGLQFEPVT